MSKRILGIFAFIILCVIPFISFGQNNTSTEKVEKVYYTIGGANQAAGIDCFDYYRFGRKGWVYIAFNAKKPEYKAGDTATFLGQINNESNLPMLKLGVYAQLYRINNTKSAHFHGDYLVDEFFAMENISINASTTKALEFTYKIPQGLAPGKYVLGTSLVEDRQFNMAGVPFLDGTYAGRAYFEITNNDENVSECLIEKDKIFINDVLYKQKDVTPDFFLSKVKDYIIKYSVRNISQINQNVKITKTLYKWDNYSDKNKIDQKIDQAEIRADAYTLFEDKLPTITSGGVYLYEVIVETATSKSRTAVRWSVNDITSPARINFAGLSNFPLKKGDKAFIFNCFQSVSDFNRYEGKIVSVLKDKSGKELVKTEYSSSDITSNVMAQKKDFDIDADYRDLILETTFYDKDGKVIDQSILNYDCSNFSTVLKKLDLDVKSGEIIVRPYDVCEKPAESKLSIEVKDSDKTPIYVEAIAPTKEFRKKLDFKDGETYQIFAMASMKVMAKMEYTHHLTKSNAIIMYIIGVILALLVFVYIVSKKNKPIATIALFIFGILIAITPNLAKAAAPGMPTVTGPASPLTSVPMNGSWNSVTNATKYKWEIKRYSDGCTSGTAIASGETSGTSMSADGSVDIWAGGTNQYWLCVKACNSSNECSVAGSRFFYANIVPSGTFSPINGTNMDDWNKIIDWPDVTGVYGYKYQLCSDQHCNNIIFNGETTQGFVALKDIGISNWDKITYYWKVKSCAGSGYANCTTAWSSSVLYFANKLMPEYDKPSDAFSTETAPLTIGWKEVKNGNHYDYQICTTSDCSDTKYVWDNNSSQRSIDLYTNVPIWNGSKYYWRARSCYDSSNTKCSGWTPKEATGYYRYFIAKARVKITSPANGAIVDPADETIKLTWDEIGGMDKYELKFISPISYSDSEGGYCYFYEDCRNETAMYTTSTSNTYIYLKDILWNLKVTDARKVHWQIRACKDSNCSVWSYIKIGGNSNFYYQYGFSFKNPVVAESPTNNSTITPYTDAVFSLKKILGADKYEFRFYSTLTYSDSSGGYCSYFNDCRGETVSYTTSTTNNFVKANTIPVWNKEGNMYWQARACKDLDCTNWSYTNKTYTDWYYQNKVVIDPYIKINSLPSPPNGIDILSPPIIFDWEPVKNISGYQYYIKNNKTGEKKEWSTTSNSVVTKFENNVESADWFHQSDDKGFEWGIRFCPDADLTKCGNANSSAWTKPSNFSVQRNLVQDAISISTETAKAINGVRYFYDRKIIETGAAEAVVADIMIDANLTGIFSSTPNLVDFDSEEARGYEPTINVGDKIRLKLNKPEIGVGAGANVVTWVIRGGAHDEPPAYWVDDAKKIYDNLTPLPSEYLYEATVNLGNLGTYYPKIGMAVTDPSKAWDKIEFKAFNASDCNNGDCTGAQESNTVAIARDSQGWYLVGNQAGVVYVFAKIPDLPTVQTIDNKWFEMGKINAELGTYIVTVQTPNKPVIDAGSQKTVFSGGTTRLDGQILYQEFMQASSKEIPVINPNFDLAAPPSATNVPNFPFIEDTSYIPTYFWECKKIESNGDVTIPLGNIVNQTDLSPMYIAPTVLEDTDVKCTVTMKIEKITTMKPLGNPSELPENIKDSDDLQGFVEIDPMTHIFEKREIDWQISSDSTIVHILFNVAPVVKDLASQETNICNSGEKASMRLTWVYKDSNSTESKAYQIKIFDGSTQVLDTGKINSASTAYSATGLDYNKTYTWEITVYNQADTPSSPKTDSFTTPSSRAPTVDFDFNKVNDPDNPDVIKYQFTDKSTVYSGTATYEWDFGDTTTKSNKQNPEHTYADSNQYTVTLSVSDGKNTCFLSKDLVANNDEYQYEDAGDLDVFNQ